MPSRLNALFTAALAKLEAMHKANRASEGPDGGHGRQGRSAIRQTAAPSRLGTPCVRQVAGGGGRASPWAASRALAPDKSVKYLSSHEM